MLRTSFHEKIVSLGGITAYFRNWPMLSVARFVKQIQIRFLHLCLRFVLLKLVLFPVEVLLVKISESSPQQVIGHATSIYLNSIKRLHTVFLLRWTLLH